MSGIVITLSSVCTETQGRFIMAVLNLACTQSVLVCHKALFLYQYYSIDGVQGGTVSNSTVTLYADDVVLYKTILSHEDYSKWILVQCSLG